MKHLKTYETKSGPQKGDYVVCKEIYENWLVNFISENIGKCVMTMEELEKLDQYYKNCYLIQYENIPAYGFRRHNNIPEEFRYNSRLFKKENVIFWSKNTEDCEIFISANKYNI